MNSAVLAVFDDLGPLDTTFGFAFALWLGVMAWLFLAHARFNAPSPRRRLEVGE